MTTADALQVQPQKPNPPTRSRNAHIVEGALLADIAIVLLLGRVYLPIPGIRMVWRLLACSPFVLLAERRGIRITIMSGIVGYVLMTALVGPTLALTVLDTALAAILITVANQWHSPRVVTALVGGLIYAVMDVVIPTIAFAFLLRIPMNTIIGDLRNGMHSAVKLLVRVLDVLNRVSSTVLGGSAPRIPTTYLRHVGYLASGYVVDHWVWFALLAAAVLGIANLAAYQIGADVALGQLPVETRARQIAA